MVLYNIMCSRPNTNRGSANSQISVRCLRKGEATKPTPHLITWEVGGVFHALRKYHKKKRGGGGGLCNQKTPRSPLTGYETARLPRPTPHFDYFIAWCFHKTNHHGTARFSNTTKLTEKYHKKIAADLCRCLQRSVCNRCRD